MQQMRRTLIAGLAGGLTLLAGGARAEDAKPVTMVVEFTVQDYTAWRPVFDGAEPERVKAGVTNPRVFRNADDPQKILVLFTVAGRHKGEKWMKSAQVREAWRKGGVIGEPVHHYMR